MRYDTKDQLNELKDIQLEEFKKDFPEFGIIVGISKNTEINSSLGLLIKLCSRNDINRLVFYDPDTISLELMKVIEILVSYSGTSIYWYKTD